MSSKGGIIIENKVLKLKELIESEENKILKQIFNDILKLNIKEIRYNKNIQLSNISEYEFELVKVNALLESGEDVEMYLKMIKNTRIKESIFCYWCSIYEEELMKAKETDNIDILINKVLISELDKTKYSSKFSSYAEILEEYFPAPYEIYNLSRERKMNAIEFIIDIFVGGSSPEMIYPIETADVLSDLSPYYLVKKDNVKLLVNIKNWVLEITLLPTDTNDKKFIYGKNRFRNCGKLKLKK